MEELESIDNIGSNNTPEVLPNATATLVLGICSIVGCFIYAIPGLVCGIIAIALHKKDKALYLANRAKYAMSYKTANAGNVCGIVGLSLSALYIIILIVMVIIAVNDPSVFNGGRSYRYYDF